MKLFDWIKNIFREKDTETTEQQVEETLQKLEEKMAEPPKQEIQPLPQANDSEIKEEVNSPASERERTLGTMEDNLG